jgi:pyruvate dehydrogenase E2 component (dihydrolipoamide acetyltransferase)
MSQLAEVRTCEIIMDFRLPSLGEGIDSATVVAVRVKPGDSIAAGQDLVDVETDKAAVSVTAETAGTVKSVAVKPGDKIAVGEVVLTYEGGSAPSAPQAKPAEAPKSAEATAAAEAPKPAAPSAPHSVTITIPNLGEGIDSATVVAVKVKDGAEIQVGQDLIDLETDKAAVSVPAEVAGTLESVAVKAGDKVSVGAPLAVVKTTMAAAPISQPTAPVATQASAPAASPTYAAASNGSTSTATLPAPPAQIGSGKRDLTPAGPATRRLARELGLPLAEVRGTGRGGRVTLDDVKLFIRTERGNRSGGGAAISGSIVNAFALPPLPDFSKFGTVDIKPISKIRETIAKNLTVAWRTMPMVTQNDLADITELEAGRKRIVDSTPKGEAKITWTVLAVKACVAALKEFPNFNSSFDMNNSQVIYKKYFNIGIAVDTERGLVVPVIRDADKKSIREIANEVQSLAEKARSGKLSVDEMRGGTFTITNLGGIGGTSFTPIVNYPEVAILGLSKSTLQPVVKDGQIVPRLMMPMSLTYDHRVIDGADGARFTTRLVQLFSDPIRLLMES